MSSGTGSSGTGSGATGDGGAGLGGHGGGGGPSDGYSQDGVASAEVALRPAPEVAQAVRVACQRLFAIEAAFLDSYHASLVHLVPILEQTTPDEGRAIADGLARSVLWAALTDDPPEVVEATFQSVGAEYYRQGFPEEGYHGAGHALLRSARDVYTSEWSSELSSGWVAYFAWLGAYLQEGARQAREAGVASPIIGAPFEAAPAESAGSAGSAHAGRPAHSAGPIDQPVQQRRRAAGLDPDDRMPYEPSRDHAPTAQVPQPRPDVPQRGWRRVVDNLFR
jgi:hypothetical protein